MCNDYARELELGRVVRIQKEMENVPPFEWRDGRIPNDAGPTDHVKIRDKGLIVRLEARNLVGEMMTWAWPGPRGKPVFNFVSEDRDFSKSDRCLILATGFYEYTEPAEKKVKLKDQHLFTLKKHDWFWIAGLVKQNCFTMLTTKPGPDVAPYHDRQICALPPADGVHWLKLDRAETDLLRTFPKDTFKVETLRQDGVARARSN